MEAKGFALSFIRIVRIHYRHLRSLAHDILSCLRGYSPRGRCVFESLAELYAQHFYGG